MHKCWGWTQIACGYSTLMTVLSLVVLGRKMKTFGLDGLNKNKR